MTQKEVEESGYNRRYPNARLEEEEEEEFTNIS